MQRQSEVRLKFSLAWGRREMHGGIECGGDFGAKARRHTQTSHASMPDLQCLSSEL